MSLSRIRITTLPPAWARKTVPLAFATLLLVGCGASKVDVKKARNSGYQAEFAVVYDAALDVVGKAYPKHIEDASLGIIKTMWHPVRIAANANDPNQTSQPIDLAMGNPMQQATVRHNRKLYFIRFRVHVVGGNPWRVSIHSEASEWEAGGVPTPMRGSEIPHWLEGRTNALRVKIHKRLKKYAVKLTSTARTPDKREDPIIEVDQSYLGGLPPKALEVVVATLSAAKARDFAALARTMHPEFLWNLGAAPSAQQAIGIWQADSSVLGHLVKIIESGCKTEPSGDKVVCPAAFIDRPGYTGYRARFDEQPDGTWKMTSFVTGD